MSHHVVNILARLTFIPFNYQHFATDHNGEDRVIRQIHNVGVDVMLYVTKYGRERRLELHEINCMDIILLLIIIIYFV